MIIDIKPKLFEYASEAIGKMKEEQNVTEFQEDLFSYNKERTRAICILDDAGKSGAGYKFVVIGAYLIEGHYWIATFYNDEFEDAIDAMNAANDYLKKSNTEMV